MSKPFRFKQFIVAQEQCAMKVGTDGVLLGAWAKQPENIRRALDIGTGSGVIALMLAQRFPQSNVQAIDVDEGAVAQADENFQNSQFANRLDVSHIALQDFRAAGKFDCIVSNPPFFQQGILPDNKQRCLARHTTQFSFEMLFEKVAVLLSAKGIFSLIIPKEQQKCAIEIAEKYRLYCAFCCVVYPNPLKAAKRVLLAFTLQNNKLQTEELTIETLERHQYTKAYRELLKDFYLAF